MLALQDTGSNLEYLLPLLLFCWEHEAVVLSVHYGAQEPCLLSWQP